MVEDEEEDVGLATPEDSVSVQSTGSVMRGLRDSCHRKIRKRDVVDVFVLTKEANKEYKSTAAKKGIGAEAFRTFDNWLAGLSSLLPILYLGLSLCDFAICDPSSSECESHAGLVTCDCRQGYYKNSPTDRICRACASGFQRTEDQCERCPLGFGGFNCEESFLLAVIVESCVGCVLLASLIALLIIYLRRENAQKPRFMDSIVLGIPMEQQEIRLPRAQFSWRREWEWDDLTAKTPTDIQQGPPDDISEAPEIQMKTFGEFARSPAASPYRGSHNLAFISDN
ncbi:protein HEG-like [Pseudophryne corroboree]|uniref:protein HEG-like n=1 Tax=Pseudophryne corroboree TaxID=495146 RepID=UPI0030813B94